MNVIKIIEAIGNIDEDLVSEAIVYLPQTSKEIRLSKWKKLLLAVACLLLLIMGGIVITQNYILPIQSENELPAGQGFFNATVLEIEEETVIVECYDCLLGDIPNGSKIRVSTETISSEPVPELNIGDNIRILYMGSTTNDGKGLLVLDKTISIFMLDENNDPIID